MKTLDEVIKVMDYVEFCCTNCKLQYDCDEKECFLEDALNYLKEFKSAKDELDSTRLAYLDILTDYVALKNYWAEQQVNPPLTWDDLTGLVGKPVWVEYTYQGEWRPDKGEWIIINLMGDDDLIDQTGEGTYPKSVYGKTWQAYRKEKK